MINRILYDLIETQQRLLLEEPARTRLPRGEYLARERSKTEAKCVHIRKLLAKGLRKTEVAKRLSVRRETIHRLLRKQV